MEPTFKEKEEDGIYTATLDGVTDNGVTINETWQWNIKEAEDREREKILKSGISLTYIDKHLEHFITKEKFNGIKHLHLRFDERILNIRKR